MLYFTGAEENIELVNSLHSVADETLKAIGHLFAASICNYGPAPNSLRTWIFMDIYFYQFAGEIEAVFDDLPPILDTESSNYIYAVCNRAC